MKNEKSDVYVFKQKSMEIRAKASGEVRREPGSGAVGVWLGPMEEEELVSEGPSVHQPPSLSKF